MKASTSRVKASCRPAVAALSLMLVLLMSLSPLGLGVYAEVNARGTLGDPPDRPFEQAVHINGPWFAGNFFYEGVQSLSSYYNGPDVVDYSETSATMPADVLEHQALAKFKVKDNFDLAHFSAKYLYPTAELQRGATMYLGYPETVKVWLKNADTGSAIGPLALKPFGGFDADKFEKGTLEYITLEYKNDPTDQRIKLKKGTYYVYLDEIQHLIINKETGYGGAWMLSGRLSKAMDKYYEALEAYEASQIMISVDESAFGPRGSNDLKDAAAGKAGLDYTKGWEANPPLSEPYTLELGGVTRIDEIMLNTSRQQLSGQSNTGIKPSDSALSPGAFTIRDGNGEVLYVSTATTEALGSVKDGIAISEPKAVLAPGKYTIEYDRPQNVLTTPEGKPDIYISTSPAQEPLMGVTGTYRASVDSYKTSMMMVPVVTDESSFSLKDHEFAVIDQGDKLQVTTKYEGMPYALMAKVKERTANSVVAHFYFNADFSNTPMNSKITTEDTLTFTRGDGGIRVAIAGTATYERKETKKKGADYNTYRVTGSGRRTHNALPLYVTQALAKAGVSAGRIPGPDDPGQLAIGLIFPSAVGLAGHLIKTAYEAAKAKEKEEEEKRNKPKLSVGEQAMADANQSLGKGLIDEEESRAWQILAEAMANTDEPDEGDAWSVGDNEKPGGADYVAPDTDYSEGPIDDYEGQGSESDFEDQGSESDFEVDTPDGKANDTPESDQVLDPLDKEIKEWEQHLKDIQDTTDPEDPRSKALQEEYKNYIDHLKNKQVDQQNPFKEPYSVELVVDHTGRKETVIYNEDTDTWTVESSGNDFDMTRYEKDVLPQFEKTKQFIEEQRKKLESRDTAFDKYLAEEQQKAELKEKLLSKLQKERDQSFGITPPAPGVGDVTAKYNDLIEKLSSGKMTYEEVQAERKKAFTVLNGRNTGRTMSEDQKDFEDNLYGGTLSIAANTFKHAVEDVVAGDTYGGMAGRVAIAIATGGASEWVLAPAEAILDMKRMYESDFANKAKTFMKSKGYNIDNISEDQLIIMAATGKFVLGEVAGEGAGLAATGLGKIGKALVKSELGEQGAKEFFDWAGDQAAKGMKKAMDVGNKPVTKALKDAADGANKTLKDLIESGTGKGTLKDAVPDPKLVKANADYIKYQAEVKKTVKEVTDKIQGGEDLSEAVIAKTLRDTGVPRDMKKLKPEIQAKYQSQLEAKIYNPTNKATVAELSSDPNLVPGIKGVPKDHYEVELVQIRTPKDPKGGFSSPINADNDVYGRVKIYATDKNGNILLDADGNKVVKQYLEVPAEKVEKVYQQKFAQQTGFAKADPSDPSKVIFDVDKATKEIPDVDWKNLTDEQRLKALSSKHNQEVTDVFHPESSKDFSKFQNADHVSAVEKILKGEPGAKLGDAQQLAQMESFKINKFFNEGKVGTDAEAMIQLSKMGKMTEKLNSAYQQAGYNVKPLSYDMKQAIRIAEDTSLSPAARNLELKKLGFADAKDLANKLSGQIESLKVAKKSTGGTGFSITSSITKTYVKSNTFKEGGQP